MYCICHHKTLLDDASSRKLCGCNPVQCPWKKCMSCCPGPPFKGGKPLNIFGICQHYCKTDTLGFAYCGDGPEYLDGTDCRKCNPTAGDLNMHSNMSMLYYLRNKLLIYFHNSHVFFFAT